MSRVQVSGRRARSLAFFTTVLPLFLAVRSHAQVQQIPPLIQAYMQPVPTAIITVDDSGGANYTTIKAAVIITRPSRRTRRSTSPRPAPSAIRIPISWRRRATL